MQTQPADFIKHTLQGRQAESILSKCVHCGFCNAVCPTYQILGDELDGPRGRIYLIKQVIEGHQATLSTWRHLDKCLTCRACETACPSGVKYGELLDIGREIVLHQVALPWRQRLLRKLIVWGLPDTARFRILIRISYWFRFLLPTRLKNKLPKLQPYDVACPDPLTARRMLMLDGCVQPVLASGINASAINVLGRLGIKVLRIEAAGCCGALPYHLGEQNNGLNSMRRLIDAWWPWVEQGVEAILITASGCGVMVKDFGRLLQHDPLYAKKAHLISAMTRDIGEILQAEDLSGLRVKQRTIAFHSPCTLQHGQQLNGMIERLLTRLGFNLTPVADAHLCCGSAGSYSLLQPEMADRLRIDKIKALEAGQPELIVTANMACGLHLQEKSGLKVLHWIELLAD